jgi:hypothetical protein
MNAAKVPSKGYAGSPRPVHAGMGTITYGTCFPSGRKTPGSRYGRAGKDLRVRHTLFPPRMNTGKLPVFWGMGIPGAFREFLPANASPGPEQWCKRQVVSGICIRPMQSYVLYHPVTRSTVSHPIKRLMTSVFTEMMSALRQQQPARTFSFDILHPLAECSELQGFSREPSHRSCMRNEIQ